MVTTFAIIPAGGIGKRMNASKPKQFLSINDKPILIITLTALEETGLISKYIIPSVDVIYTKKIIKSYLPNLDVLIVKSGKTRQESVYNGLEEIKTMSIKPDLILVHDAVRALIKQETIIQVIKKAQETGAAIAARPVSDTLKLATTNDKGDLVIKKNVSRDLLWQAQTPQVYHLDIVTRAYDKAKEDRFLGTDSAGLVERIAVDVSLVESPQSNIKITTPEDLKLAELYLRIANQDSLSNIA